MCGWLRSHDRFCLIKIVCGLDFYSNGRKNKSFYVSLHINTKTHLHMGQLEDFRASLKRKDSAVSSEGEIPVKSIAKEKQEKMKRRTLGVSGELHLELKALSVWRIKSHPKASPGITDTIQEMMRVYYKKYPEAKEFVEKFCE